MLTYTYTYNRNFDGASLGSVAADMNDLDRMRAKFEGQKPFNYVEKYGWPKIIHQFTLKILFLIKNLLKVTLFSVKIL
ncbi:hypothetical protein [Spiroplasma endosymbiont of Amphimallon solstitiale]|uniref:hypothetical protein n=1 Tax=Spiroplasma endosymbiont of Amphimallon solstitiale TaxID=3066288 RepID=UPI00313EDFEF